MCIVYALWTDGQTHGEASSGWSQFRKKRQKKKKKESLLSLEFNVLDLKPSDTLLCLLNHVLFNDVVSHK